ncbi:hypothetical protein ACHAQE_005354 [Botrytis cinerea]
MPEAVAARDKHGARKGRGDTRDPDSKRHASISVERRSKKPAIESTNTPTNSTPVETRRHTTSSSNPPLSSTSGSTSFKPINSNPIVADPSNSTIGTGSQPNVIENEKDKKRLYKCQEPGCESPRKFFLEGLKATSQRVS